MLAIGFDIGAGYLAARFIRPWWLTLIAGYLLGMLSATLSAALIYAIYPEPPTAVIARAVPGVFVMHPALTIIVAFAFRRWNRR